jgi:hypothetical protein
MATVRNTRVPCVKEGSVEPTRHEMAIRMLINRDDDIHRNGFAKAHDALADEVLDEEWREDMRTPKFLPDAYKFDRETETIIIYEVDDTHPIPPRKLREMAMLWFDWDCFDCNNWLPELRIVDRYGNETGVIDLCEVYYAMLPEMASPTPTPESSHG